MISWIFDASAVLSEVIGDVLGIGMEHGQLSWEYTTSGSAGQITLSEYVIDKFEQGSFIYTHELMKLLSKCSVQMLITYGVGPSKCLI